MAGLALRVSLAVTWLTVYRQLQIQALGSRLDRSLNKISGMATFDGLVLRRSLLDRDEALHAGFYWHELAYRTNGMLVSCLRAEDTLGRSIFFV